MNKQIIIITIVIVSVLGLGGWYFFATKPAEVKPPETTQQQASEDAASTVQPTPPPQTPAAPQQTEQKKALSTIEKITARSFAEKVLKLIQNRDYGKVYDLLTDGDKAVESRTEYVKRVTETSGSVTITSWQIKEVLEEQDGASVQYVANYDSPLGSGSETGILNFVQKNGKWFLFIGAIDTSKAVIKGVGDEIVLATIKFKINAVNERQTISTNYGSSATAKEGTKFIVVDMTITNLTKTGMTFPVEVFQLTDNQDRNFETYKNTFTGIDNYLNLRELPPSIPERGVVVYEIPMDATSYSFTVAKAGTKDVYKVILK